MRDGRGDRRACAGRGAVPDRSPAVLVVSAAAWLALCGEIAYVAGSCSRARALRAAADGHTVWHGGGGVAATAAGHENSRGCGDDVGDGGGVNSASFPIARRSGSSWPSFATCAVAVLHSLGRGGAVAGAGAAVGRGGAVAGASAAVGAVARDGAGRVVFGNGGNSLPGGDFDCSLWSGVIVDSAAKPLLVWPGEGTKRWRGTGGSNTGSATL